MTQREIGCVRPRLRHDVTFTDTGDGVLIRAASEGIVIKGAAAYVFATKLAPFLTGERTLDELCAALPADRRRSLTGFVQTLLDHGFARNMRPASPVAIGGDFTAQLSFVEHYLDDAAESFLRFQNARILVVGVGPITAAAADSLVRNGSRNVTVIESTVDDASSFDAACGTGVPQLVGSRLLALPAMIHGGSAFLGPAARPGRTSCWICLQLWLEGSSEATPALSESQAAFFGNAMAVEVFRQLTGVPAQTDGHVVVTDLKTLESRQERVLRHPLCSSCAGSRPVAVTTSRALSDPADGFQPPDRTHLRALLDDLDRTVGRVTGPLTRFDDTSVNQVPLKVGRVRLRQGRLVTGFDLHHVPVARQRAVHAALPVYAGEVAGIRSHTTESVTRVAPQDLVTWSGRDVQSQPPWLPAVSLLSGTRHVVPASAVYPFSSYNETELFDRTSGGDGAGPTIEEAARRGLLSVLAYDALGDTHIDPVRLPHSGSDPELDFLIRTLAVLGLDTELTNLTPGRVNQVVLARSRAPQLVSVGAALSLRAATVSALRDLIGQAQLHREGLPFDLGNPLVSHPAVLGYGTCALWTADAATADLYSELTAHHLDALVVDTTPPDVAQLGMATVRVLLRRSA